jgi:hypothetical protein
MTAQFAASTLALLAFVAACSEPVATPDEQIRSTFTEIERASRAGDVAVLRDFVSARYRDGHGRNRDDLQSLIRYQYLRHNKVYLLTPIEKLEIAEDGTARTTVLAAMASAPVEDPAQLRTVRADVYRFDLELLDEGSGDWKVLSGDWRPADLDDFL